MSWESAPGNGSFRADSDAFIFSLDYQRVYGPYDTKKAVKHHELLGPNFGGTSLGIFNALMSERDAGLSIPNRKGTNNFCSIPVDREGDNVITGVGKGKTDYEMTFTLSKLVVYKVVL